MFNVEYRTIGQNGRVHPSQFANVGSHMATSSADAAAYIVERFGRVQILAVKYVGSL